MHLERLSNLDGVSGNEGKVRAALREIIAQNISPGRALTVEGDALGNLLVRQVASPGLPRIMLSAHMDEVGLMITSVEKSGHLRFRAVGSIDSRVLVSKTVRIGDNAVAGVIGCKAIHLQKPPERRKPYEEENLFIDIGASSRDEAEKMVQPGDYAAFDTACLAVGEGCYRGKAFDDRAGCAVLLELLLEEGLPPFDAAFTVQEEVGSRGAAVAAYTLRPEVAVVLEGTSASDTPGTAKDFTSTVLGDGPALSFMDRSFIADRNLMRDLVAAAEEAGIPYQFRRFTGGATDAGAIALTRQGVRTAVVSVPCRYIHSPCSLLKEQDLTHTADLIKSWLRLVARKLCPGKGPGRPING